MKKFILFLAMITVASAAHASNELEICVVGAGIGFSENRPKGFYYMTGIGPEGAEKNPIIFANSNVSNVLTKAAYEMRVDVKICMKGKFVRRDNNPYWFLAFTAQEKAILKY